MAVLISTSANCRTLGSRFILYGCVGQLTGEEGNKYVLETFRARAE